jgi:hypothetical protein
MYLQWMTYACLKRGCYLSFQNFKTVLISVSVLKLCKSKLWKEFISLGQIFLWSRKLNIYFTLNEYKLQIWLSFEAFTSDREIKGAYSVSATRTILSWVRIQLGNKLCMLSTTFVLSCISTGFIMGEYLWKQSCQIFKIFILSFVLVIIDEVWTGNRIYWAL